MWPVLGLLSLSAIWGLTFSVMKEAIQVLSPLWFVAVRFTFAFLALAVGLALWRLFYRVRGRTRREKWTQVEVNAGIQLGFVLFLGFAFQTVGLRYTSATNAGFITGLCVVLVPPLNYIFTRTPVQWSAVLGVLLATIGLCLLTLTRGATMQVGDGLVLLCAIAFAYQIVQVGRIPRSYSILRVTLWQLGTCAVASLVSAVIFEQESLPQLLNAIQVPRVLGALLFCSLAATLLAFWAQTHLQRKVSATRAAVLFSVEPVFGFLFSYCLLGEVLTVVQAVGAFVMLAGIVASELGESFVKRAVLIRGKLRRLW